MLIVQVDSARIVKCPPPKFFLWTSSNKNSPDVIRPGSLKADLAKSHWRAGRPVKVIIHGWAFWGNGGFAKKVKTEYLKAGDFNIIAVDYNCGALRVRAYTPCLSKT